MKTGLINKLGCKDIESFKAHFFFNLIFVVLQGRGSCVANKQNAALFLSCPVSEANPSESQPTQSQRQLPVNMFFARKHWRMQHSNHCCEHEAFP